jgi:hypothetical protein
VAACLHRLSTGLCTPALDVCGRWGKTVGAVRYNGHNGPRGQPWECAVMGEVPG